MALNSKTLKYVPTTKKEGRFVTMGFGVEIGDLERISSSYINDNFCDGNRCFVGVISRAPHNILGKNLYAGYSDQDMISIRMQEAVKAANIGSYASLYLLNYASLKEEKNFLLSDYKNLLNNYRPDVIFTFSPFDDDIDHIVSLTVLIEAIKQIKNYSPKHIFAVNTFGDFGAFNPEGLIHLNLSKQRDLINSLISVYVSIKEEGKVLVPGTTAFDLSSNIFEENFNLLDFCQKIIEQVNFNISSKFDSIFKEKE